MPKKSSMSLPLDPLAQSRSSLLAFCMYMQKGGYKIAPHHIKIAKVLEMIDKVGNQRVCLSVAPRMGKSFLCSQHFPAWYLGRNPDNSIITTTYGQDLASDWGRMVRNMMITEEYQRLFNISISPDSKSKKRFNVEGQSGAMFNVGKGGVIQGRGGHVIVVDDILERDEAMSPLFRKKAIDFWRETLSTRMMPNASVVVIGTRFHENDLIGYLLENEKDEGWVEINIPCFDDEGESIWPEFHPTDKLRAQEARMPKSAFSSQYLGTPIPDEGSIVKKDWFKYYTEPIKGKHCISVDCSFKGNDDSDFVVMQLWQFTQPNAYLVDWTKGRWGFTDTLDKLTAFIAQHESKNIGPIYIEDKANGSAIIDVLRKKFPGVIAINPDKSKVARLNAVSHLIQAGNVLFPKWKNCEDLENELLMFPYGKHDDQVDTLTMALSQMDTAVPVIGF